MARSSADDMELKRSCEAGILSKEKDRETVVMSMRVAKGRGVWGKAGKLASRHMAKPRVLAVTSKYILLRPLSLSLSLCFDFSSHPSISIDFLLQPRRKGSAPRRSSGSSSTPMAASSRYTS